MTEQATDQSLTREAGWAEPVVVPATVVRGAAAALALAVAAAHVADQGGLTQLAAPDWLGWAYRLIEIGGVLTAVALVASRTAKLGWAFAVLLGAAPFLGYLTSRTVGVPGDPGDVGNWADWIGILALVVEAGLVIVGVTMLRIVVDLPTLVPTVRTAGQERAGSTQNSLPDVSA